MDFSNMFYNGKAKAGSACFAGPAFVDSVESFKDPLLLIFRNTYAGVLYREITRKMALIENMTGRDWTKTLEMELASVEVRRIVPSSRRSA